jgi:HemY protein
MSVLIAFVIAVIAAVVVGILLSTRPGFVLISYGMTQVEFTLFIFILIYLGAVLVGWVLWWLLRRFVGAPRSFRLHRRRRNMRQAERFFTRGTIALAEGHARNAERDLERAAEGSLAFAALIAAAHAADLDDARDRRDNYYRRALEVQPKAAPVVLLTQSDQDLARGDYERALASLQRLRAEHGEHPRALVNLAHVYESLHEYRAVLAMLPELERKTRLDRPAIERMAANALRGALVHADTDPEELQGLVPRKFRDNRDIRRVLARGFASKDQPERAAKLLARNLDADYDATSATDYAALDGLSANERLHRIEGWLRRYPQGAALAREAGRLALELRLWGQARQYLDAAHKIDPNDVETALLAGRIAEEEGRQPDALGAYRAGLEASVRVNTNGDAD